jgi:hypothetical protein
MALVIPTLESFQEKRLAHREEAEEFYRALIDKKVRVGQIHRHPVQHVSRRCSAA